MNTRFSGTYRSAARLMVALIATVLASATLCSQAAESASNIATNVNTSSTNSYGSGKQYKTTIERHSEGELSAEDLHQASLLTSQLLIHLNEATQQMADAQGQEARSKIEKAGLLAKVVRSLLPVTVVTTVVKDTHGKEIYRDVQHVQDDQIPIFSGAVAVEVVEPIVEAKRDEATLKGVKLADADLIRTAMLVDLSYVERKLKRAVDLLSKPQEAAAELALAQTQGIRFHAHKEDSPLVQVQHALRLAERQVREKKYEGARANLQLAKVQLEAYRALIDDAAGKPVADMEKEIQKLSGELQSAGTADKIRGLWDRVAGSFKREAGQAHQTSTTQLKQKPTS
jgi:hypothetical protein